MKTIHKVLLGIGLAVALIFVMVSCDNKIEKYGTTSPSDMQMQYQDLFNEVVWAEDKWNREARKKYPIKTVNEAKIHAKEFLKLSKKLTEKYRNEVLEKYKITKEKRKEISKTSIKEKRKLPPTYNGF